MKLLLVFAFLALVCMARSAPAALTTPRVLILPDYHADEEVIHEAMKPHEDEVPVDVEDDDDDEDDEDTTTTTTTTTRRSTYVFPTRNRNLIPSRRPIQTQRTTSVRTTTTPLYDDEESDTGTQYDGDFKYIKDFRKYFQQLLEGIKKLVRNLTGYDLSSSSKQQKYIQNDDD